MVTNYTYDRRIASSRYELVYSTGGTGGPYPDEDKAKERAEQLLRGNSSERWIAVIDAKDVNNLTRAKALWVLKRGKGWEKGPRPLPNVNPVDHLREARSVMAASVLHEVAKNLNDQFGSLVKAGDSDGLVHEEAKMVREFQAGIRALRERLGLLKKSTAYAPSLPDAAFSVVWTTGEKEGSTSLQRAIAAYEEAIQTAVLAAISAERWFADNILALDPRRTLFNWPTF